MQHGDRPNHDSSGFTAQPPLTSPASDLDDARELMADLEALMTAGLVVAVREVGGATRYRLAPQSEADAAAPAGNVFIGG